MFTHIFYPESITSRLNNDFTYIEQSLKSLDLKGTAQYNAENEVVFVFNVAGYKKEDITVSINKKQQQIRVVAKEPAAASRVKFSYNLINKGSKQFVVNTTSREDFALDYDAASTELADGLLRISIPKKSKEDSAEVLNLEIK